MILRLFVNNVSSASRFIHIRHCQVYTYSENILPKNRAQNEKNFILHFLLIFSCRIASSSLVLSMQGHPVSFALIYSIENAVWEWNHANSV